MNDRQGRFLCDSNMCIVNYASCKVLERLIVHILLTTCYFRNIVVYHNPNKPLQPPNPKGSPPKSPRDLHTSPRAPLFHLLQVQSSVQVLVQVQAPVKVLAPVQVLVQVQASSLCQPQGGVEVEVKTHRRTRAKRALLGV